MLRVAIGVDIGGTSVKLGLVSEKGKVKSGTKRSGGGTSFCFPPTFHFSFFIFH